MKKMMIALLGMLTIAASGKAMSYEQARNEALFLTDKMAYELNLTDEQYEAAYEINLDYLMGVTSYDDVYGDYWERRNRDLSYILLDAQWQAYIAASYFYRPLYWSAGYWHFGIYARYPHRDYFYFGRPVFYATYRGAHAWHLHGTHGYYYHHRDHFRPTERHTHFGMHDRWNRGDFRHHHGNNSRPGHVGSGVRPNDHGRHHGDFGGPRTSSTRTTVNNTNSSFGNGSHGNGSFGNRDGGGNISNGSRPSGGSHSNGSLGGGSHNNGNSHSGGAFSRGNSSGSFSRGNSSGNFGGGQRSGGTISSGGSRSSGSFSSGGSRSGGSFSNGGSHSGGSRSSGSFGSRR